MTLEEMIESIRAATAPDASPEQRGVGAEACRMILTALAATSGEAMAAPVIPASDLAGAIGMLRGVSPDQLLELAIAKLRAALPAGTESPRVEPIKFHIVQLPRARP